MNVVRIWTFLVGDSRRAPIGVAVAVLAALALVHALPSSALVGVVYLAIVVATLVAAALER